MLGHENFADVSLPNEDNFFMDDRATGETPEFSGEPCMTDCKETVEITARAASLDVTPEDAAARKAREAEAATAQAGAEDGKQMAAVEAPAPEEAADADHDGLDPPLVAQGEKAFRQCQACHMVGEEAQNRVGPVLTGIVGAPAGNIDGFDYSNVLREAAADGLVWTEETLSAFLADPRSYMEGTKMSFAGLTRDAEVAAVIAFLKAKSP